MICQPVLLFPRIKQFIIGEGLFYRLQVLYELPDMAAFMM